MVIQLTAYLVLDRLVVQATAMRSTDDGTRSWERLIFETWPTGKADTESPRDMLGEVIQCVLERLSADAQGGKPPWA